MGSKARDGYEEGIADGKQAGVDQSDHIARVGFFDRFAVTTEQPMRPGHPDLASQPGMIDHHVLLKAARTDAKKSHPVAMLRVHVRLDFEHKAGEGLIRRLHLALRARAWTGRRGQIDEGIQKRADAEVGQCAAEEHRREFPGEKAGPIE